MTKVLLCANIKKFFFFYIRFNCIEIRGSSRLFLPVAVTHERLPLWRLPCTSPFLLAAISNDQSRSQELHVQFGCDPLNVSVLFCN